MAFVLLPRPQRSAMCALYAFCREVDDVADEDALPVEERRHRLAAWREDVRAACNGGQPRFPVNRELQPVIRQFNLPFAFLEEIIKGCEMDLDTQRFADWAELETYCYRVASAVGLLSIEIFGYRNPACREYAVALGKAFQLTNILRDIRNDAERGRIYLPRTELDRFAVSPEDILAGRYSDRYQNLASCVAARAREYYRQARENLPSEDRPAMIAAELMGAVYWRLLGCLEARQFDVFHAQRVRVSKPAKAWLVFRTWWRLRVGPFVPNYGTA